MSLSLFTLLLSPTPASSLPDNTSLRGAISSQNLLSSTTAVPRLLVRTAASSALLLTTVLILPTIVGLGSVMCARLAFPTLAPAGKVGLLMVLQSLPLLAGSLAGLLLLLSAAQPFDVTPLVLVVGSLALTPLALTLRFSPASLASIAALAVHKNLASCAAHNDAHADDHSSIHSLGGSSTYSSPSTRGSSPTLVTPDAIPPPPASTPAIPMNGTLKPSITTTASGDHLALEDEFLRLLIRAQRTAAKAVQPTEKASAWPVDWPKDWPMYWEGASPEGLGRWV